jgi:hypothetical protein
MPQLAAVAAAALADSAAELFGGSTGEPTSEAPPRHTLAGSRVFMT